MIISRTPLRMSFVGGGTDLADYYKNNGEGAVLSTTINKYVYVFLDHNFEDEIRVRYSDLELVKDVNKIKHDLVRESLRLTGIKDNVSIITTADIPSKGSGLGSSSSLTVGLLNAFYNYKKEKVTPERLARDACKVEIEMLEAPIGKQDQYIAAYGGMNHIVFKDDESVQIEKIKLDKDIKQELENNLLLFYTGVTRQANFILAEQKTKSVEKSDVLTKMKMLTQDLKEVINGKMPTDEFGKLLHKNWLLKKQLVKGITNPFIEECYHKAMKAGATGGKILGAGGGGFLLFYCPVKSQDRLRQALVNLKETKFKFEEEGSKIIHLGEKWSNSI